MGSFRRNTRPPIDWSSLSTGITTSRTPLRVSFVGGGTDVSDYWSVHGGEVVSAAINQYMYVFLKGHGELFEENIRLNYSEIELKSHAGDIKNMVARGCLEYLNFKDKIYIGTVSDVPSESGLGSSSAFAVGLLNSLYFSACNQQGPSTLANEANHVEITHLKRPMGKQDAYPAAFGGLNRISFNKSGSVSVTPIQMNASDYQKMNNSLFLVFTGTTRNSSNVLSEQVATTKLKTNFDRLNEMKAQVGSFVNFLENEFSLSGLGNFLNEAWLKKRSLSKNISSDDLNSVYEKIIASGSLGAKLCGAGGGGFFLCVVPPENKDKFVIEMKPLNVTSIEISSSGSQIL